MGSVYSGYHRTVHDPWESWSPYGPWVMGKYTTVRSMTHGECILRIPPYGPWVMGKLVTIRSMTHGKAGHRTVHDPWESWPPYGPWVMGRVATVRSMTHGECILWISPYGPWPMGKLATVRSMGHGKIYYRTAHDPWEGWLPYST